MDNRGRFFTTFTAAALFALGASAPATAQRAAMQVYLPAKAAAPVQSRTAEDSERVVDQVAAEANARIQAGQPAEDVEAWLGEQLEQAGMTVQTAPPSWDVFGSAAWEQENPGTDSADNRKPNDGGIATIDGFNSRNPVDGRYEHSEEKEDPQFSDQEGAQDALAAGEAQAQAQGEQETAVSARGGAGDFFVYAGEPGRRAGAAGQGQATVRLRAGEVAETGRAVRGEVDRTAGVSADLRSRLGQPSQTAGNSAAGADTE